MGEELRRHRSFHDVPLYVTKSIVPQCLNDLRHVEECHIDGVAFKGSHGILQNKWMVAVCRQEIRDR